MATRPRCSSSSTRSAASAASCASATSSTPLSSCATHTPVQGPLAVGDLNGSVAGVPPDEIVTVRGRRQLGIFGFAPVLPLDLVRQPAHRARRRGLESAALGDLDNDHDLDVLVGQTVNSLSARVTSIHYFKWGERRPRAGRDAAALDAGRRRGRHRRRGRRRVQRRRRRRHLRDGDGAPRQRRGRLRRRPGPPAARLPEPGHGDARDDGRGRPDRRRPAGDRHRRQGQLAP